MKKKTKKKKAPRTFSVEVKNATVSMEAKPCPFCNSRDESGEVLHDSAPFVKKDGCTEPDEGRIGFNAGTATPRGHKPTTWVAPLKSGTGGPGEA